MNANRYQEVTESAARWSLVGIFFVFPIKTSVSNVLLALMLLAWVLAGQYRKRWADIRSHPITLPALAMYGLVVLGTTYSPADFAQIANHLNKYSKFLIMLICLSLLTEAVWRERCRKAFMFAMAFVIVSTYANIWFQLPWSSTQTPGWGYGHTVVKDYIFQGICTALFVLMALTVAVGAAGVRARYFWGGIAALAAFSCTHLLAGRTGVLALGMALFVYAVTLVKSRLGWVIVPSAAILFGLVMLVPGAGVQKSYLALQEFEQHKKLVDPGAEGILESSTGARLTMWKLSLREIAQRPLLGAGTASYHGLAENYLQDERACSVACVHPHNQFLFFGVEYGLVGLLAFVLYFLRAAQHALRQPLLLKATTLGFLAIFLADSMVHGSMWLSGEQHLFTYMLALWMSYPASQAPSDQSSSTRLAG
jgi:O-antigen ligase